MGLHRVGVKTGKGRSALVRNARARRSVVMPHWRQSAFGLDLVASFPLPGMRQGTLDTRPDVALWLGDDEVVDRLWSGTDKTPLWETTFSDGCPFRLEAGRDGDHLMTYGDRARFQLSAEMAVLVCAPAEFDDADWQRQLLDTVLVCTSALRGFQLLHAGSVLLDDGVVTFSAMSGAGKTTLTAELADRGHPLFADDVVALHRRDGRIVAHPGPPLMNLPLAHPAHGRLGRSIAVFGEDAEAWIEVDRVAGAPAPLTALYLLDRRPGVATEVERLAPNPLYLLPHSLGLRHHHERYRARFETFADIVAQTPVYRLSADVTVPPAELADLVEASAREAVAVSVEAM